ncbi:MAG: bifunctional 5,10-methylenetetrahydrofolate dehydrogenase/5,10-methenyltetrahydrofolate cyclohydrolase [Candidatus Magasanikbacteria bacterium]|nr:bifunctional 5,10-methylenetetrahydrofolate dehydrogenase/5,10-methenyltetrahydrofolate cyclohydrolase [Candidatus Magasanikbacteria bacterium]
MGFLINGQSIADAILADTKTRVQKLARRGVKPKLAVILVGEDKASAVYVRRKQKAAELVGINFQLHKFSNFVSKARFIAALKKIQADKKLQALIIQLPLPEHLYNREVLNTIRPELDIDFLTDYSLGSLITRSNALEPATPGAMLEILRALKFNFVGRRVVVVGAGALVGRPLALLLLNLGATPIICNSKTKNLAALCRLADAILTCVGQPHLIKAAMVKPGAIVVDAGFAFENDKALGDVDVAEVARVARAVTPTPGGVGPVTVAKLLFNTVRAAELKK